MGRKGGLRPDRWCTSVLCVRPAQLLEEGVAAVLLDLDNTLQSREKDAVDGPELAWLESLRQAGIACCIVSNSTKPRVRVAARELGMPVVQGAYKPFTRGYRQACQLLGVQPRQCVMVGDQCYTDILGAHRAGMRAVMVRPLCGTDPFWTHLLRRLDAWAVRGMPLEEPPAAGEG